MNDTIDGMIILYLWVWISQCRHCQAIQGMAGQSSSVVEMIQFCYRSKQQC